MSNHSLFSDTVTLYLKRDGRYMRIVLAGVQFRQKVERGSYAPISAPGISTLKAITTITVPAQLAEQVGLDAVRPDNGDVVVLGSGPEITEEYPISSLRSDFNSYCTVRAVSNNSTRRRLKHWKVYAM